MADIVWVTMKLLRAWIEQVKWSNQAIRDLVGCYVKRARAASTLGGVAIHAVLS